MKSWLADLSPASLARLTARDVMTPDPVTVGPLTPLFDVVTLMAEKDIRHFPVLEEGRLTGMLTERDLRDALPSVITVQDPAERGKFLNVTRVWQVVSKAPPATV